TLSVSEAPSDSLSIVKALVSSGNPPGSNSTSTTGPITCTTFPVAIISPPKCSYIVFCCRGKLILTLRKYFLAVQGFGTADNIEQFSGYICLSGAIGHQ